MDKMASQTIDISHIALALVRLGLFSNQPDTKVLCDTDWDYLLDFASTHGLVGLVWDGICKLPINLQPERNKKINWALSAEEIADRYQTQQAVLARIIDSCNQNGLRCLLLKGVGIAHLYPNPPARPSGDIDVFFFDDFDKANTLFAPNGYDFDGREASFDFCGVSVENHAVMIYEKSRKEKVVEAFLMSTLDDTRKENSGYYRLSPVAEVIYLMMHTLTHLYSPTYPLPLRSIIDFGICLKANRACLDFDQLLLMLKKLRLTKSFQLLVSLSEYVLDIQFSEFHYLHVPTVDVNRTFEFIATKAISHKIPANIPFGQQLKLQLARRKQFRWLNPYLPYSRFELLFNFVYHQLLVATKKMLHIPENIRFAVGIKNRFHS